jgi:hypothetical protein
MVSRRLEALQRRLSTTVAPHGSRQTITELRSDLVQSGKLDDVLIEVFLARCPDPNWWTQAIAFTGVHARAPALEA